MTNPEPVDTVNLDQYAGLRGRQRASTQRRDEVDVRLGPCATERFRVWSGGGSRPVAPEVSSVSR
jgi:hypothetical protein